jgi:hypothetical protein
VRAGDRPGEIGQPPARTGKTRRTAVAAAASGTAAPGIRARRISALRPLPRNAWCVVGVRPVGGVPTPCHRPLTGRTSETYLQPGDLSIRLGVVLPDT